MSRSSTHLNQRALPRPGEIVEVTGLDLDRKGHGLARWQGWVLVIPDLLPGERAEVQLQQRRRSQWLAKLVKTLDQAPGRQRPPCILASDCGGCSIQHLKDSDQSLLKQHQLKETLTRIGAINHPIQPLLTATNRTFGYRNRGLIPLRRNSDGNLRMGYYKQGSHKIVNLNRCPVLDPRLEYYLQPIKEDLQFRNWPADADLQGVDGLRHLGLRIGHASGEILITLISSTSCLPGLHHQAKAWIQRWDQVKGVTLNLQPNRSNLILGTQTLLLAGESEITEQFCGLTLKLATTTFFQINTPQAEHVVEIIREWFCQHRRTTAVIDAFCGIGTIALPLAAAGLKVLGLEINADSIEQARNNARMNGLNNVQFRAGDVGDHLLASLPDYDGLVVDPPRKGLTDAVVEAILNRPPRRVAYLSCDPATLARDLRRLTDPEGPYKIEQIQPVDFFPQTTHLECLVLLNCGR